MHANKLVKWIISSSVWSWTAELYFYLHCFYLQELYYFYITLSKSNRKISLLWLQRIISWYSQMSVKLLSNGSRRTKLDLVNPFVLKFWQAQGTRQKISVLVRDILSGIFSSADSGIQFHVCSAVEWLKNLKLSGCSMGVLPRFTYFVNRVFWRKYWSWWQLVFIPSMDWWQECALLKYILFKISELWWVFWNLMHGVLNSDVC